MREEERVVVVVGGGGGCGPVSAGREAILQRRERDDVGEAAGLVCLGCCGWCHRRAQTADMCTSQLWRLEPEVRVPTGRVLLFTGLAASLRCPHMAGERGRERASIQVSFHKGTLHREGANLMASSNPNLPPKAPPLMPSHGG